jgi:hypothetical protein
MFGNDRVSVGSQQFHFLFENLRRVAGVDRNAGLIKHANNPFTPRRDCARGPARCCAGLCEVGCWGVRRSTIFAAPALVLDNPEMGA